MSMTFNECLRMPIQQKPFVQNVLYTSTGTKIKTHGKISKIRFPRGFALCRGLRGIERKEIFFRRVVVKARGSNSWIAGGELGFSGPERWQGANRASREMFRVPRKTGTTAGTKKIGKEATQQERETVSAENQAA
ncbi:MAG: hypothetical protein WAM73_09550 [Desulfobacterales bacterium]